MTELISKFCIMGERCSGTHFLQHAIQSNFPDLSYDRQSKHFFAHHDDLSKKDETLFIAIIRHPIDWIDSFFHQPHHVPNHLIQNWSTFLTGEWSSYVDFDPERNGQEIMEDRCPESGQRFKNILALRSWKSNYLYRILPCKVPHYAFIRYEDLRDHYDTVLESLQEKFGLRRRDPDRWLPVVKYKGNYSQEYKVRPVSMPEPWKKHLWDHLDLDLEKEMGYHPEPIRINAYAWVDPLSDTMDDESFCALAKEMSTHLPDWIQAMLKQFVSTSSHDSILMFSAPSDGIPFPTPPDNTSCRGRTTHLAKLQAVLLSVVADMISYEGENQGSLFQDIVPNRSMESLQTSLGSRELEIHTEQAFSDWRPDILSLACLRSDPNALTYILSVDQILAHTTEEEHAMMRQPLWTIGVDLSFDMKGEIRGPIPILSDQGLTFDQDLMNGLTEEANHLLDKIVRIYYEHRTAHCLKPGDILFINNRKAVHGRSGFEPRYDGQDRFLVRCFGTLDLEKSEKVRQGRTVLKRYS